MKIQLEEQFNIAFEKELEQIPEANHIKFINNEIKEIEKKLEPREYTSKLDKRYKYGNLNLKPKHVFRIDIKYHYKNDFINAFQSFHLREVIEENENSDIQLTILQACEFAKHYNWLIEYEEKLFQKPKQKESKLTLNQKVLALHYLGLDLKKYDRTKSSNILSQIIGENESNIRKSLNYINSATKEEKIKNEQNLKKLIELFENEQFDTIKNKIKGDLEKVEVSD